MPDNKELISKELISIVVPSYNEEAVLEEFYKRVSALAETCCAYDFEFVFVNDGSIDSTLLILNDLKEKDHRVTLIDLSRNFGKEIALTAGIDYAKGDAVVPIDADLQDPPELITDMIDIWKSGFDVVYATRKERAGETWWKKSTARAFYKLMSVVGEKPSIPRNTGDFRLMTRAVVDDFCKMRERHRFLKGLFSLVGYKQCAVYYNRDARYAGETKWNYFKLINLSIEGITSFTTAPLRLAAYFGFLISFLSFLYAIAIIYKTLSYGDPVAGYPSLVTIVLFLGGVQLVSIGIIGEYLGRIFNETKNRPLYFVKSEHSSKFEE